MNRNLYAKISLRYMLCVSVLLCICGTLNAQTREITGKVTALVTKEPLPGVNVLQKGTAIGTITDSDGNYSITAGDSSILVFSTIGFLREEIRIGKQQIINVMLTEDVVGLDEIVVVGYGEQKRSNVTGAVASVDVSALENRAQLRLDQALQGMVAGVTVTRNGGAPGASASIHIRGVGSINNTEPLWIVDGIRMDPGNHFDLDDVETIEVLKDAAASAIYGARAANGVILVTTKRGKGALQVTAKSSAGYRQPIRLPRLLNREQYVRYQTLNYTNAGLAPDPSWYEGTADTDWVKEFYGGNGLLYTSGISLAKGDDKFNFYLSLGHDRENGIVVDNSYQRSSLRINSDIKVTKWLKVGESLLLSRVRENPVGNNNENRQGGIPYRSLPLMPVRDPSNKAGGWGRGNSFFLGPNPVATQYQQHADITNNRFDGNFYAELTPVEGLTARATVGLNYRNQLSETFNEKFNYGGFALGDDILGFWSTNDQTVTKNAFVTYGRGINKHNVKLMAGAESITADNIKFDVSRKGFVVSNPRSFNLAQGVTWSTDPYNIYQYRFLSYFGRVNYNYDEKYLMEANIRRDGSSLFGPTNRWGVFPSLSVAWRVSQEPFFSRVPHITNLKLRASVGKLGSEGGIAPWQYVKTYTGQFDTYSFDREGTKQNGAYVARITNDEVKWEEVNIKNVALDVSLFQNKLSFSFDYYIKETKDLLFQVPVANSVGIAVMNHYPHVPAINIGTMRNRGIDVEVSYKTTWNKFNLQATSNASVVKNQMLSLFEDNAINGGGIDGGMLGGMTRTQPGHPISSFYGYIVQRIFQTDDEVAAMNTYSKTDGFYQVGGTGAGDFMYKDISGPDGKPDGEITTHDRVFLGNPWPKMTYAFNLNLSYNKMVDIAFQFQGVHGVDIINANKALSRNFFGDYNTTTDIMDAWTAERPTSHPRNVFKDPNGNFSNPSSYFIEDGSYLKLRNVQLGFTLPSHMLSHVKINRLRIYLNANNIFTITKYTGFDPEVAGSNLVRGVDYGTYPQVRTYMAGVELQF